MLTPQEVSEHAFAKATFGGYNMAMVDEFLDLLTSDYTALYNENAVLKSKMKVLADKVEEYRSTEDDMRKALMTARKMADEMVQEAERDKQTILEEARQQAGEQAAKIHQEVTDEEYRLTAARNATAVFVEKLKQQYQQELDYLENLSKLVSPTSAPAQVDKEDQVAQEIESSVQRLLAEEEQPAQPEPAVEASAEPEEELEEEEDDASSPTRRVNLDRLEFGRNYEIG